MATAIALLLALGAGACATRRLEGVLAETRVTGCKEPAQIARLARIHQAHARHVKIDQKSDGTCLVGYVLDSPDDLNALYADLMTDDEPRFSYRASSATLEIDGAAISGRAVVTVSGRLSPPGGTVEVLGNSYPVADDGSFEIELEHYGGEDWIPARHRLRVGRDQAICIPIDPRQGICYDEVCNPGFFSRMFGSGCQ